MSLMGLRFVSFRLVLKLEFQQFPHRWTYVYTSLTRARVRTAGGIFFQVVRWADARNNFDHEKLAIDTVLFNGIFPAFYNGNLCFQLGIRLNIGQERWWIGQIIG